MPKIMQDMQGTGHRTQVHSSTLPVSSVNLWLLCTVLMTAWNFLSLGAAQPQCRKPLQRFWLFRAVMDHASFQTTAKYIHPKAEDLKLQHQLHSSVKEIFKQD